MKIKFILTTLVFVASSAFAQATPAASTEAAQAEAPTAAANAGLLQDFDSLSGNDVLLDRAHILAPEIKTQIVQNRVVTRPKRFEFSPEYSNIFGGDSYVKTHMLGLGAQYHINYRWSVGVKYDYAFNELSDEAESMIKNPPVIRDQNGVLIGYGPSIPDLDYIKQSYMATVNWYPIYGKFSLYDMGVVHFDMYGLAGAGQVELASGETDAMTAGGGMAFWFSQHLTSRLEVRWMGYKAELANGAKEDVNLTLGTLSFGYIL